MRVLLIWPREKEERENLILALKNNGHEVVYCVGPEESRDKFPDIIFHNYNDAYNGKPAKNVDINEFPPPIDLIKKLHRVESTVLTMMNKRFDAMLTTQRKHLYYNMVQYWYGVIKRYKPEIVIFPTVPHAVFNFIIFELAKVLNIKTFMFEDAAINDRLLYYSDFWDNSSLLRKKIEKNKGKNFSIKDLSQDLQKYYKMQTDSSQNSTPADIYEQKSRFTTGKNFLNLFKIATNSIKDFSVLEKTALYFIRLFKENVKKEYKKLQIEADFNKKFIYLPLHYQPERTSCPQGGIFVDQVLIAEVLSAALPDDWVIYVKEHPIQWLTRGLKYNNARYQGYYKKISSLKNVYIIPIETDTYKLLNKSQAIATITGTVGREAIMRLKPVIVFGYPWYKDCPGVFKVNDYDSCKRVLERIKKGININQQDIINYLKSFDEATIHGHLEKYGQELSLTEQENIKNFTKVMLREINK